MFNKIIFIFFMMLFLLFLYSYLFICIFNWYLPKKTFDEFGKNVVFFSDKAGAFSTSGFLGPRIWCTKDVKDISMNTIFTRAALKYLNLDWNHKNDVDNPIYFGIVDSKNDVYSWSFKKMDYVLMDYPNGWDSLYHIFVKSDARKCALELE